MKIPTVLFTAVFLIIWNLGNPSLDDSLPFVVAAGLFCLVCGTTAAVTEHFAGAYFALAIGVVLAMISTFAAYNNQNTFELWDWYTPDWLVWAVQGKVLGPLATSLGFTLGWRALLRMKQQEWAPVRRGTF